MHRVEALVAGIRGAENGTFSAVIRGTSTPATYYTDFEGNGATTATSVALDQYGGKVAFFDRPVTITAYSSGGSAVRTWTAGDDAGAVELKSASFTGTAYSGGAVAVGNPTTVEAAMDAWISSAGAPDFKVAINSVATDLDTAFTAVAGLRYYVVTNSVYGAVGNGVTNDLSAIQAAINAANTAGGGVVFFPPGTYLVNGTITSYANVSLLGYSASLSIIKVQSSSSSLVTGAAFSQVEKLTINFTAADYTGNLFNPSSGTSTHSQITLELNKVSGAYYLATTSVSLTVKDSILRTKAAGVVCSITSGGVAAGSFTAYNTTFGLADGAVMSGTSVTAGTVTISSSIYVAAESGAGGAKTGISGTAIYSSDLLVQGPAAGMLTLFNTAHAGGSLQETGTRFIASSPSFYTLYGSGITASTSYPSVSKTTARDKVAALISGNTEPFTMPAAQARVVTAQVTNAGTWTGNAQVAVSTAPEGSDVVLSFWNNTGGLLTFEWSTGVNIAAATTFTVAANSARQFYMVSRLNNAGNLAWFLVSDTAGALVIE